MGQAERRFATSISVFILPKPEAFNQLLHIVAAGRKSRTDLRRVRGCLSSNRHGRSEEGFGRCELSQVLINAVTGEVG